jgi:hypothetical protein
MGDSNSTVSGYSYFQEDFIKVIKAQVNVRVALESTVTSTIKDETNSLIAADVVLNSNFDALEFDLNQNKTELNFSDNTFKTDIDSIYNIARLPDTGEDMVNRLNQTENIFGGYKEYFESNNMHITSQINSLELDANNQIVTLETNNASLIEKLTSYNSRFNSNIPGLETTDSTIVYTIDSLNAILSNKITSLQGLDINFENQDNTFNNKIVSLHSAIDTTFSLFDGNNQRLENLVNSNLSIFNETVQFLNNKDIEIESKFDTLIDSTHAELADLLLFQNALAENFNSNISVFDAVIIDLNSTNSDINSQVDSLHSFFGSEFNDLTSVNDETFSTINENYLIYSTVSSELHSTDDSLQRNIVNNVLSANTEITDFTNFDNSLYSIINENYAEFENVRDSLTSLDNSMVSIMNTNTAVYNLNIDSIVSLFKEQESRIAVIDFEVGSINNDITSRVDYEISLKLTDSMFDEITDSLLDVDNSVNNALVLQVAIIAQSTIDSTQWSLIDGKAIQTVYDSKMGVYDSFNQTIDDHLRVIEEGFRTILITYGIDKPDSSEYDYTAVFQNLNNENLPPIFEVVGKRQISATSWGFDVKLTPYGYNTFLNKMTFVPPTGVSGTFQEFDIVKSDFNSTTLTYIFSILNSRLGSSYSGPDLPFNIQYKNTDDNTVYYVEVNSTNFGTMKDVTPINVTYTTTALTFTSNSAITPVSPVIAELCGPNLQFSITTDGTYAPLPEGLSINTSTGVISGTPTSTTAQASYLIRISNPSYIVYRTITFAIL